MRNSFAALHVILRKYFFGGYAAVRTYAMAHKMLSVLVLLAVIGSGWWAYAHIAAVEAKQPRYVLGTVTKGTIVSSVSASGQVSVSNQLDVKPRVSGEVVYVPVEAGQTVAAGALLAQLDSTDAQKSVRDARANLESAEISLEKLQKPASALTLTQARNALSNAQDSLSKLYSDSNTLVVNVFLDVPSIMTNLESILIGDTASNHTQWNIDYYQNAIIAYDNRGTEFRTTAYNDYLAAKSAYDTAFAEYQSLGTAPDTAAIEKSLTDSYAAVRLIARALKSSTTFIQLYIDTSKAHNFTPSSVATAAITSLAGYTNTVNSHLSSLVSYTNSLKQDKQSIDEKQQSLDDILAGADDLDVRSAQLSVTKAKNALQDAQNNLADYYVRAPFAGTIAAVQVKKYDSVGSGTAIATLITNNNRAELSLNEVDAAKIKVGDKATLTFDAIDSLTLTGKVSQIDAVGTVTQGVVSYAVTIGFDSQDPRIKPGMTVNAAIITDARQDVLMVPASAVKTQNGASFVQAFTPELAAPSSTQGVVSDTAPRQIPVEVGISDDTNIEITSGVSEGQQIVVRTITASAQTTTQTAPSLFGSGGARGAGGGARNATFIAR